MKILILGDSISAGWGAEKGYPGYLEDAEVINSSIPGSTVVDGYARLKRMDLAEDIDLFICQFGTNDGMPSIWGGEVEVSLEDFNDRWEDILDHTQSIPKKIFIGPIATTDEYINKSLFLYNEVVKRLAKKTGAAFLNLYDLIYEKADLYQGDGMHPNEKGHFELAQELKKLIY